MGRPRTRVMAREAEDSGGRPERAFPGEVGPSHPEPQRPRADFHTTGGDGYRPRARVLTRVDRGLETPGIHGRCVDAEVARLEPWRNRSWLWHAGARDLATLASNSSRDRSLECDDRELVLRRAPGRGVELEAARLEPWRNRAWLRSALAHAPKAHAVDPDSDSANFLRAQPRSPPVEYYMGGKAPAPTPTPWIARRGRRAARPLEAPPDRVDGAAAVEPPRFAWRRRAVDSAAGDDEIGASRTGLIEGIWAAPGTAEGGLRLATDSALHGRFAEGDAMARVEDDLELLDPWHRGDSGSSPDSAGAGGRGELLEGHYDGDLATPGTSPTPPYVVYVSDDSAARGGRHDRHWGLPAGSTGLPSPSSTGSAALASSLSAASPASLVGALRIPHARTSVSPELLDGVAGVACGGLGGAHGRDSPSSFSEGSDFCTPRSSWSPTGDDLTPRSDAPAMGVGVEGATPDRRGVLGGCMGAGCVHDGDAVVCDSRMSPGVSPSGWGEATGVVIAGTRRLPSEAGSVDLCDRREAGQQAISDAGGWSHPPAVFCARTWTPPPHGPPPLLAAVSRFGLRAPHPRAGARLSASSSLDHAWCPQRRIQRSFAIDGRLDSGWFRELARLGLHLLQPPGIGPGSPCMAGKGGP